MVLRTVAKIIFVSTLLFGANVSFAEEAKKGPSAAERLSDKIGELKTYQANFEQRVRNESGKEIDFTSGIFSVERPNLFRWEVKQSFEQIIVADGKHIFTYDPELEQVTIQNQSKALADSPLLLMTSTTQELAEAFDIELLMLANEEDANLFKLTPKKEGNVFSQVHILFKNGEIAELMMADTLGQQTSIQFSEIKTNQKLEASLFQFTIPDDVDIIDSRESDEI